MYLDKYCFAGGCTHAITRVHTQDALSNGRAPSSPNKLPVPALIAVVACVAAVGAELATGKTIVEQFQQAPGLIIGVSALFAVATLIVSVFCSHMMHTITLHCVQSHYRRHVVFFACALHDESDFDSFSYQQFVFIGCQRNL